jgi:hypothetical protein
MWYDLKGMKFLKRRTMGKTNTTLPFGFDFLDVFSQLST